MMPYSKQTDKHHHQQEPYLSLPDQWGIQAIQDHNPLFDHYKGARVKVKERNISSGFMIKEKIMIIVVGFVLIFENQSWRR